MAGPDQHQIAECLNRAITLVRLYAIQDTYMYHVVVMTPILLDVNEMSHLNRQNGSGASRNQLLKAYTGSRRMDAMATARGSGMCWLRGRACGWRRTWHGGEHRRRPSPSSSLQGEAWDDEEGT